MARSPARARLLPVAVSAMLAASAVGCEPPSGADPDAAPAGPVAMGVDPAKGEHGVPIDKVIRVRFSDHLDERTLKAGRLTLKSGTLSLWVMSYYDPVRGELVVWPSSKLRRFSTWTFRVEEGLAGLDGGAVAPGTATWFRTGDQGGDDHPFDVLTYEEHVQPIFDTACAACHGGPGAPVAGLALDTPESVTATLLGAPAEGWPGWKRAVAGRPGQSYLLYKLIGDARIAGSPMPRSFDGDGAAPPLSPFEQRRIADWVAGGAPFFDSAALPD